MQTNTVAANDNGIEKLNIVERAVVIRHRIKAELGAQTRDFSVRVEKYSMGATVHITIKVNTIRLSDVERIAECYASPSSYFMRVSYADEALAPMVQDITREIDASIGCGWESTDYRGVTITKDGEYYCGGMTNGLPEGLRCWGVAHFARTLATALLEGAGHGWGVFTNWDEPVNSQVAFLEAVGAL